MSGGPKQLPPSLFTLLFDLRPLVVVGTFGFSRVKRTAVTSPGKVPGMVWLGGHGFDKSKPDFMEGRVENLVLTRYLGVPSKWESVT